LELIRWHWHSEIGALTVLPRPERIRARAGGTQRADKICARLGYTVHLSYPSESDDMIAEKAAGGGLARRRLNHEREGKR